MYIGLNLNTPKGLAQKLDELNFTFSIKPESIPLLDKYGVRLIADEVTIEDVAPMVITEVLENLGDSELSLGEITSSGRNIKMALNYTGGDSIGISISDAINKMGDSYGFN